jgi:hypothetical protein
MLRPVEDFKAVARRGWRLVDPEPEAGERQAAQVLARRLAIMVIGGLLLALAWHGLLASWGLGFPWNTFLFLPSDRFADWQHTYASACTDNPYFAGRRALSTYFPVAYALLRPLCGLSDAWSVWAFQCISLCLLGAGVALWGRGAVLPTSGQAGVVPATRAWLLAALVLSYPWIFALDRGNLDAWIASLCLIHVALLQTRLQAWGHAALALAIAMKGYPAALLLLSLANRRYREAIWCAMAAVVASVLLLLLAWDGAAYNLSGLVLNLRGYFQLYVLGDRSLFASSDPYNAARWVLLTAADVLRSLGLDVPSAQALLLHSHWLLGAYSLLALAFALVSTAFVVAVPAAHWRKISAACLLAVLYPNVAGDYKLNMLAPATLALVTAGGHGQRERRAFWLLAMLMVPKSLFFVAAGGVSMLLNAVLLVLLTTTVLADPPAWRRARRRLRIQLARRTGKAARRSAPTQGRVA